MTYEPNPRQRSPRLAIPVALSTLVAVLGLSASSHAQVLPLVVDATGDETAYWWSESSPQSTAVVEALAAALGPRGLDPARLADPPSISRVYRTETLPRASALNLAELYGATSALVGRADTRLVGPVEGDLFWVAEVHVDAVWIDVATGSERARVDVSAIGEGAGAEAALDDATRAVADAVAAELSEQGGSGPSLGAFQTDGPVLIVRRLASARPLVGLLGELRARDTVVADLHELWASEGALAYRVELAPGTPLTALTAVFDGLASDSTWGYELDVVSRDGATTEVTVWEREPESEPAPPGSPSDDLPPSDD